jgi:hypothetical protein
MLGLQSRDHAKKRKENTGKRLEGNILLMTRHFIGSKKTIIVIVILMLTNITINRSYSIGSTLQLQSINCDGKFEVDTKKMDIDAFIQGESPKKRKDITFIWIGRQRG